MAQLFAAAHSAVAGACVCVCVCVCGITTRSAYLPILRVLMKAINCTPSHDGPLMDETGSACLSSDHVSYAVPAAIALLIYLPIAHRFLRCAPRLPTCTRAVLCAGCALSHISAGE